MQYFILYIYWCTLLNLRNIHDMTFYICRFNVLDGGGVGDSIGILRPCPDINPSVSAEFSIKKKYMLL